ncbi:adenosylcobalamin-dependent ribonucleoside-diphosphate reductase, partial [candidate division WWE3 bacterium]|nr:adenosylcobalamin-dependent ribonucleoside-diphosphate reductase [candidate division WWE3 bacterium]
MSPKPVIKIKKRDGRIVAFDKKRIVLAISKAGEATNAYDKKEAIRLADIVVAILEKTVNGGVPEVEQIQDIVEQCLMAADHYEAAKAYILYRQRHEKIRQEKAALGIVDDLDLPMNALRVLKSRHLKRNADGDVIETPGQLFERVSKALAQVDSDYKHSKKEINQYAQQYYDMMVSGDFIPGGSYLRNAGYGGPMSNCHVLGMPDDIAGIYESIKQTAILTKSAGGGVGFNFSHIRPAGDYIASSGGLSTGPVSFMRIVDMSNTIIGMGGYRKGASMGVLNINHPDILEFINAKQGGRDLTTFNVSVGVTDSFMKAVEKGDEYNLVNPRTNKPVSQLNARAVFDLICSLAHDNGDPGMLFLDTANKTNPLPGLGPLESTNICGEQWLHPYDVCNLGSINLANFVTNGSVDYDKLERITALATRFMDNGVDLSTYAVPEVQEMAKANRRIGLGVMGWADMLIQLEIPYDSDKAITLAKKIMKTIDDTAYNTSSELAREKGNFANYDKSIFKKKKTPMRNAARTTVAPTGSISMVADCSSG